MTATDLGFGDQEVHDFGPVEIAPERRAGIALDIAHRRRQRWQREHRQPAVLTAREALAALQFEALLVWTAAHNLAAGIELSEADLARLTTSCRWIDSIAQEVL